MSDNDFPQWGFWISGVNGGESYNVTSKRHLFLTKNRTACGYSPPRKRSRKLMRFNFSAVPKIPSIYETMSDMERGRLFTADDFSKCKRCLKSESKGVKQ